MTFHLKIERFQSKNELKIVHSILKLLMIMLTREIAIEEQFRFALKETAVSIKDAAPPSLKLTSVLKLHKTIEE